MYPDEEHRNSLLQDVMKLVKEHRLESNLSFHEVTHDIDKVMLQANAVGLFSTYEGFPNAICEAMACAKPVICSNVSDMKSFLAHSPNLLCDPQDVYSIKEALCSLLRMDAVELEALGIQNRAIAVQNFEKDRIVERYLLLLGAL